MSTLFLSLGKIETKRIHISFDPVTQKQLAKTAMNTTYTNDDIPDQLCSGIYEMGCQDGCTYKYNDVTKRYP